MKITLTASRFPSGVSMHTYTNVLVLLRKNTSPRIIMQDVEVATASSHATTSSHAAPFITGNLIGDFAFSDLQDNDIICYPDRSDTRIEVDAYPCGDMLLPFDATEDLISLLCGLEHNMNFYICPPDKQIILEQAIKIYASIKSLYNTYPAYQHIMLCRDGKAEAHSFIKLIAMSSPEIQQKIKSILPAFIHDSVGISRANITAKRAMDYMSYDKAFQLLNQEDQVSAFIEFARLTSTTKKEHVSDTLLDEIKQSNEYGEILKKLAENNLGVSQTQQFNVLQQVGYLSAPKTSNILYNLSDMGAGKTLMTVEAICLLDLKYMSVWSEERGEIYESLSKLSSGLENNIKYTEHIGDVYLPDKNIIAPTLSVKSSWIDTFRLFYDVEEIDDYTYRLSITYKGITAYSNLYVSSFTIKNGLTFVTKQLPSATRNAYLIIDEVHQLVIRNVARTKFFQPKTNPSNEYKTFILSGTLSNLQTHQWYNYMRLMGIAIYSDSAQNIAKKQASARTSLDVAVMRATQDVMALQHRQFDCDDVTIENLYHPSMPKKMTSYENMFYTDYGTQIMVPSKILTEPVPVDALLLNADSRLSSFVNPAQVDTTNFQLFYKLVGSQAITAQSQVIAEELFGEQQQQHISDIIKTISPLSKEDIVILKTLHHIAEDYNKYKSSAIANTINTAILNLNDGLQTKNIYDIISHFAEKNIRFFEYLTTLDINVLERLPQSQLIVMPKLEDTEKFKILQDILQREKNETHLIVVNDLHAAKALAKALNIESITKEQLRNELDYQATLDDLFKRQTIVIVPQSMIKSSLDLVQANRLIQYQLNTEISDIIQTQNRINRIGQTRETRGYYIASDALQENLIELFLTSYRNIRVAHKGIVELFVDITSQINIVNNYLSKALSNLEGDDHMDNMIISMPQCDIENIQTPEDGAKIAIVDDMATAILYPQQDQVLVLVPLDNGSPFQLGTLSVDMVEQMNITTPVQAQINTTTYTIV